MKNGFILSGVLILLGWFSVSTTSFGQHTIAILQIVEHEALDQVRAGVMAELAQSGLDKISRIDYFNAQGNFVVCGQIGRKLLGESPSAIVAIGTPAAQAVIGRNQHTPVIFSPISDPVSAKLVKSLQEPGGMATGSSDFASVKPQIELIQKIIPKAKKIGIIYNSGEVNSLAIVEEFRKETRQANLEPVEGIVQNTAMVLSTAKSLKADAIFIPTDNTVASAIEAIIKTSKENKIPIFSADATHIKKGAIGGWTVDYHRLGQMAGKMLIQILKEGKKPGSIPVAREEQLDLMINKSAAISLGLTLPPAILEQAKTIL